VVDIVGTHDADVSREKAMASESDTSFSIIGRAQEELKLFR